MSDNQLFKYTTRVLKKDAAFFYFQLEANEGICFFSTLKGKKEESYRDILVQGHISLEQEFLHIADKCKINLLEA